MLMLYQFPVSHYCEIARWGLDYKQQAYQKKNLLPGLHVKRTRKLTGESSVPIWKFFKSLFYFKFYKVC